jgi:hypothetical protein
LEEIVYWVGTRLWMAIWFAGGVWDVEDGDGVGYEGRKEMGGSRGKWISVTDAGGRRVNEVPNKGKAKSGDTNPVAGENEHAGCGGEGEERVEWKGSRANWMFLVEVGGREAEKVLGGRVHIIGANHRFVFGGGKGQKGEAYR